MSRGLDDRPCDGMRQLMDDYLSDRLDEMSGLELQSHLEQCPGCSEEFAAGKGIKEALKRAVAADAGAPAFLRARISKATRPRPGWNLGALALAACLFLVLGGLWAVRLLRSDSSPSSIALGSSSGSETVAGTNIELLKIGYADHVHCALYRDFSDGPRSFEQMAKEMGPEFIGLVPLVKERVPADFSVMVAHHCQFEGRDFVHLILNRSGATLSIILTRKNGESFDPGKLAVAQRASEDPLYRTRMQQLEVIGFETRHFLAYVVSGLAEQDHLKLASTLAPTVRRFLAQLEV